MKTVEKQSEKKKMIKGWIFFGVTIVIVVVLLSVFPEKTEPVTSTAQEYLIEMMIILPAVMIIMGLFAVFIPSETVVKYLGKTSGIKGIALSILIGTLPTGPLYIAFPMEMVELQFLGIEFMVLRLILTVIFVIIMGVSIEKIIEWNRKGNKMDAKIGVKE